MKKQNISWHGEISNDPELYILIYKIITIVLIYIKYLKMNINDEVIKDVISHLKELKDISNAGYISNSFHTIINSILNNYLLLDTGDEIDFGYFHFLTDL